MRISLCGKVSYLVSARHMVELGWNHYLIKLWTIYLYSKTPPKSVAWMHLFHKNVSFRNISCWPGRVHYVHGHISCNGHASTFCHTNSSGRCHCCHRDDGSVEEEVGVPWCPDELKPGALTFLTTLKTATLPGETPFLDRVWECPSPTNNGR